MDLQFITLNFISNYHLGPSGYKGSLLKIFEDKFITTFEVKPVLTNYELLEIEPDRNYSKRNGE